jgi:hypothetical protein
MASDPTPTPPLLRLLPAHRVLREIVGDWEKIKYRNNV